MPYELHGWGSDTALSVSGPDVASCCAAAVEGFAAAFVDLPAGTEPGRAPVEVTGEDPADLLAELLEEAIGRLDATGEVAVGLADATLRPGSLGGTLLVVPLDAVQLTGPAPKAVTWHDRRLAETVEGWEGHVVIDL